MAAIKHELAPGFEQPVHGSQACFRALLDAMSRPGKLIGLEDLPRAPAPLSSTMAAVTLTLVDADTRLCLTGDLGEEQVTSYLTFHSGAPIVEEVDKADFLVCDNHLELPALADLKQGEIDYPDRSATIILAVTSLTGGFPVELSGPGLEKEALFAPRDLDETFWNAMQKNHMNYPLGIDVVFCDANHIAAVPRSTRIRFDEKD